MEIPRGVRVWGPEKHGNKFRVTCSAANGTRERHSFDSESDATAFILEVQKASQERTLSVAVTEYLTDLGLHGGKKRGRPVKPGSLRTIRAKLTGILRLADTAEVTKGLRRGRKRGVSLPLVDRPLSSLTPREAARLYQECVDMGFATDTHRSYLTAAQAFGDWCAEQGWYKVNPFAGVKPQGTLSTGKATLRLNEARQFIVAAYGDAHRTGGIAAATVLTTGLRAHELVQRTVRDLDDNGRLLWIPSSKTAAGRRRLTIPPVLRLQLLALAKGQGPNARLFGTMTIGTLLHHVYRLCEVAGVPKVCTHGLRGTQISLTVEVDQAVRSASRNAGHANTGVTRRHYMAVDTEQSARALAMEAMLMAEEEPNDEESRAADERETAEAKAKLEALLARRKETLPVGTPPENQFPN